MAVILFWALGDAPFERTDRPLCGEKAKADKERHKDARLLILLTDHQDPSWSTVRASSDDRVRMVVRPTHP